MHFANRPNNRLTARETRALTAVIANDKRASNPPAESPKNHIIEGFHTVWTRSGHWARKRSGIAAVRNKHATAGLYPHGTTAHTTSIGGRPRRGSSRHKHHTMVAMADINSGGNDIERQCRIEPDGIGEGSSGYVWRGCRAN
jgi:hypothetical protein